MQETIINTVHLALRLTIPFLLISLGGLFCLKTGVFNLALDGFALFGCFTSVAGTYYTGSVLGGVLFAGITTSLLALIFAVFVLELKVDAIVCSLAMILICTGITRYLLSAVLKSNGRFVLESSLALKPIDIPFLENIPIVGQALNNLTPLAYIAFLLVPVIHIILYKTKFGFQMRVVGLNEQAAEATGVNIKRVRYIGLIIGGFICGLAGAQLALSINMFNVGMSDGRGFTAFVILVMADSRPVPALLASLMFGGSEAAILKLSGYGINAQILAIIPYLLAFAVAILPLASKHMAIQIKRHFAARTYIAPIEKLPGDE
ncbi:ABC transporter permease [Clostridia bacterium]|nr:ABC transporter permease [Clostridia bacterium]